MSCKQTNNTFKYNAQIVTSLHQINKKFKDSWIQAIAKGHKLRGHYLINHGVVLKWEGWFVSIFSLGLNKLLRWLLGCWHLLN